MSAKPEKAKERLLGYFEDSGVDYKRYSLIRATYYEDNRRAQNLVETDPQQINRQDPYAGLTPLHIAVFRQNRFLVQVIGNHPETDFHIRDNFNRKAVDMLDYTSDQVIFELIMDKTYPDQMRSLEDEAYENALKSGQITPFRPKDTDS